MRPRRPLVAAARRTSTVAVASSLLLTALVLPTIPAGAVPDETFADDFQTGDFAGSTGSQAWSGPWIESGENDGVGAGLIQVDNEANCVDDMCLVLGKDAAPDAEVTREVDLEDYASATLTFDYQVHEHGAGAGTATLKISSDGGTEWVVLDSWALGIDEEDQAGSYDISDYLAAETQIAFSVSDSTDDSHMNVDNLEIAVYGAVCYLVGDNSGTHQLTSLNLAELDPLSAELTIGHTGADLRAIALHPASGVLYAATADQLHTVDTATGAVVTIGPFGSSGPTVFNQIETLSFDPTTGFLYASHYRAGDLDLIFQVDPATGSLVSDAFGVGTDYVAFTSNRAGQESLLGLAVDSTGQMWGMGWDGSNQEKIHTIDKYTGTAADVGNSSPVAGLSIDPQGIRWGIDPTGRIFEIQAESNSRDIDNSTTYTGLACPVAFSPPPTDPGIMVISEFDTSGDHFVELYNAGGQAVEIDGFTLEIEGGPDIVIDQGGTPIVVPPGGHYLLVQSGTPLAASADQLIPLGGLTSNIGLRLRDDGGALLDEVGAGSSAWGEGTTLPSMGAGPTQSYERLNSQTLGNCIDTSDNLSDFVHNYGHNNPQNSSDPAVPCGTPTPASHVVVSEFRPEGPAGEHDEFVEIFNPTGATVDIGGWIFHITEPGLFRDYHTVPIGTTLQPGEHYLLSDDDGPAPNDWQPYDVPLNYGGWGDVVLKDELGMIVDVLGYGDISNGQLYEGVALPYYDGGNADRSFVRRNGGYTDTDNNLYDFVYSFVASPQVGDPGPNRPPFFDQDLGDRSDAEGSLITIPSTATDPDSGDTLTYAAVGLPQGISVDPTTGLISGALGPDSAGVHAVTLMVADDGIPNLGDTDVFTWTVSPGEVTYLLANSGGGSGGDDLLTAVDLTDPDPGTNEVNIGTGTGTSNIQAIALQPATNTLFAVEDDQLGTIDLTTGVFTPKPSIAGAGNGAVGLIAFDDIEGLSFNPFTGELYGTHRRGDWQEDLLFQLDPVTGAHLPGAFGGDDYLLIANQGLYYHAADIAFDPVDGQLYAVHWSFGSSAWSIAMLDPATGATVTIGATPEDIAGLAFDESGRLHASTDAGGMERVYELNKIDASVLGGIDVDNGSNYEALAIAFPIDPNQAPVFDQDLLDRTDPEGTAVSLSAAATDPDGHNVIYAAMGLPPGLLLDPVSGLISGTIGFAATGNYAVEISATDDGIPNLGATDTFTWTVSEFNRPPVFDQDLLDRTDTEGATISLPASATDPDATDILTYGATGLPPGLSIDPGSGLISGTIDYTAAAGSPYAINITATDDGAPPESAVPDTFTWTVNNTNRPPAIVNPGPQTAPELAPFSLTVNASDPDGTKPSFADSGTLPAWAVLTDNLDGTATIAGTPGGGDSGTTTVTVTASDGSLTDDAVFDLTITNTNQPPSITNPGDQAGAEGTPFTLTVTASDLDGTTVGFSDGGTLPAWATLTDNGDDTATISGTPGYTDAGTTTVTITASDGSLTDDATFDISVSNTNRPPVVNPIADQSIAEGDPFTLIVTASDPDGAVPSLAASGLPVWASFVDNGDGTGTITGTPGYTAAATNTVTITASDGSLPGTGSFDLTVTNTNRPPTVNPIGDQLVAEGDALVPVVVTATDPDGTIPSLAATGLPGWAGFVNNGDGTGTISGTPGYADSGVTTVTIQAEDGGVPNLSASTSFSLTVSNTNRPPVVSPIAGQIVAEGEPFSLTVTATDPDGTIPSPSVSGLPGWAGFVDNGDGTGTISGTPGFGDTGMSVVTVTATDGSLSDDETFDLTVTDTNRAPVFDTDLPDRADLEGATIALSVGATDPDLDNLTYSATSLPFGLSIDPGSGLISGTIAISAAAGSPYAVEIRVTDDGTPNQVATDTFFWTVTDVNQPPAFDHDLQDRIDPELAAISLSAVASDPDNDILVYAATGLPPGLSIDPASGLITGTIGSTAAAGSPYSVELTVTDSGVPTLTDSDTFTWTVTEVNRAPKLEWIPDLYGDEETLITFTATATDADLDDTTYSVSGAPPGADIDPVTGVFTWTPTEAHGVGSYAVTVTATDDSAAPLSDSQVVTITVKEVNRRPEIEPIADQVSGERQNVTLLIVATDPDLPTNDLEFGALGLPPGLAIEPATGVISGTVGSSAVGHYPVRVTVTDNASPPLLAIAEFDWKVTDTNQPPELSPIAPLAGDELTRISFTAVASDPDGDDIRYSLAGAPPGAAIDPATGRFSWTPSEEQGPETYSLSVLASDDGTPQLQASRTVTIDVGEVNTAPSLTPLTDQSSIEGQPVTVVVVATDPDDPANGLIYTVDDLPAGLQLDPISGLITGTPTTATAGSYEVTVTVTDDGSPRLDDSTTFVWEIVDNGIEQAPNEPPTISPIEDQYSAEEEAISLHVTAVGTEPITYAATGLPPGLALDARSGVIYGVVAAGSVGSHEVTITAAELTDPSLRSATEFVWIVTDVEAAEQKEEIFQALGVFDEPAEQGPQTEDQLVRRSLVVMGSAAAATTESLRWPFALLLALVVGFATIGRVGLYPLLWRGERHSGVLTLLDLDFGFGLIDPDEGGEPLFVHVNSFPRRQRPDLAVGMRVRFRLLASDNRSSAWGANLERSDV